MRTAAYVQNRLPTSALNDKTPHECWTNEVPDINGLRTFGCDAYVRTSSTHKRKGGDKARLCTFLGQREGLKGIF